MSDYLVGRIRATPNIKVHEGVQIAAVQGERRLEGITLRAFNPDGDSEKDEMSGKRLRVAAVFVFIGAEPGCSWLPSKIARDKLGYILTGVDALRSGAWPLKDREPCPLETTVPGFLPPAIFVLDRRSESASPWEMDRWR